jgi:hypothetical protein
MRIQHVAPAANRLSMNYPNRVKAKAVIVAEGERLRWCIWAGKAKNAQRSIDRIHKVMHDFTKERHHPTRDVSSRKLWSALHEVDGYLSGQSACLVNHEGRCDRDTSLGVANVFARHHRPCDARHFVWRAARSTAGSRSSGPPRRLGHSTSLPSTRWLTWRPCAVSALASWRWLRWIQRSGEHGSSIAPSTTGRSGQGLATDLRRSSIRNRYLPRGIG